MPDETKLKIMDKAVHDMWRTNPIAFELKRASHRHGGRDHDIVLANAFAGMHQLLSAYAQLYEAMKNEAEAGKKSISPEKPTEAPPVGIPEPPPTGKVVDDE